MYLSRLTNASEFQGYPLRIRVPKRKGGGGGRVFGALNFLPWNSNGAQRFALLRATPKLLIPGPWSPGVIPRNPGPRGFAVLGP